MEMEGYDLTEDSCLQRSATDFLRSSRQGRLPMEYLQEADESESSDSEARSEEEDLPLFHNPEGDRLIESRGSGRRSKRKRRNNPFTKSEFGRDTAKDRLCGVRDWRPACLQPLANVYTFVTLVGLSYFMSGMAIKSLFAQVVSIERQFNIDSSHSGLFGSAWHLGYSSTILLVGHFARVTHIPLAIGVAGIINGLLVMAPSFLELYAPYKLSQFDDYNTSSSAKDRHVNQNHQYLCRILTQEDSSPMFSSGNFTENLENVTVILRNATVLSESTTAFLENATFFAEQISNLSAEGNLSLPTKELALEFGEPPLDAESADVAPYAYQLLLWSLMLQGAINSFRYGALPYVYVDDNVLDKTQTGTYLAISFVFAELTGPVGDLINGVFSNIPVDLSDTDMSRKDPRFVSAWWLGFLLFGGLSILAAIPIMLLPKHLVPVERQRQALAQARVSFGGSEHALSNVASYKVRSQDVDLETDGDESEMNDSDDEYCQLEQEKKLDKAERETKRRERSANHATAGTLINGNSAKTSHKSAQSSDSTNQESDTSFIEMLQDLPKSLVRILRSPLYALLVVEMTIIFIPLNGIVWPFRVKYIMFEYNVTMAMTNTAKGLSSALTHIAGTLLGSLMSRRISTNMGYLRLILLTAFLSWLITPLLIYFGCDNKPVVGLNGQIGGPKIYSYSNVTSSCECDSALNLLSCGSDGMTYLSPCHAGCQSSESTVFYNCSLVPSPGTVSPGLCDAGCFDNFIIFNVLTATQTFIFSINNMPRHLLALRILEPKDRAFGSAFLHFAPFIASLPAPFIFGKWMESMCLVWSSDHCSLYDRNTMRYLMMGVEVFVAGLTVLTYVAMVIICRHLDRKMKVALQQQDPGTSCVGDLQSDDNTTGL